MATTTVWGILLGGMVYSHIVFFPVYLSDLPDSAIVVNGPYGLNDGAFWSIVHPVLILLLLGTVIANWRLPVRRRFLVVSVGIYFLALVVTILYFLPGLEAFADSPNLSVEPSTWLTRGQRWQQLSWLRGTTMVVGFLPLLFALKTSGGGGPEPSRGSAAA